MTTKSYPLFSYALLIFTLIVFTQCEQQKSVPSNEKTQEEAKEPLSILGYENQGDVHLEKIPNGYVKDYLPNPYNFDNIIYKGNRRFQFEVTQNNTNQEIAPISINIMEGMKGEAVPSCFEVGGQNIGSFYSSKIAGQQGKFQIECFVENAKNILFPMNVISFKEIIFAPTPFIQLDQDNSSWTYENTHQEEQETYSIKSTYQREENSTIKTAFGALDCQKISSSAITSMASKPTAKENYRLVSYFHPQYGFVKLEYAFGEDIIIVELKAIE